MFDDFLTEEKLIAELEEIIYMEDVNYIEAILTYCDRYKLDVEDVKSIIGPTLKERIRVDAMNAGLLKKEAVLPFD